MIRLMQCLSIITALVSFAALLFAPFGWEAPPGMVSTAAFLSLLMVSLSQLRELI